MEKEENKSLMVARSSASQGCKSVTSTKPWVLRWNHWSGFRSCRSLCSSINLLWDFHPRGWAPVRHKIVLLTDGRRQGSSEHKLSFSPGEPKKVQFTCSYSLYPKQCSHICAIAAKPDWHCIWMENLFVCFKSYLSMWVHRKHRPWVVIWYLTRSPEAGWSSWLFTALGGGANYRRGAGATPLNSDYSHFVTPGGLQALSFKPVINIHSNLIVCAETT